MVSPYFTKLPVELLEEIVKYPVNTNSPHALANLARVCKIVHNWITPILYKSVFLSNAKQIALFAASIEETPRLRSLVSELCIFLAEQHVPLERPRRAKIERESPDDWEDPSSCEEESAFPSDVDDEEDGTDAEDLILEHEAVPEDLLGSPPCVFTAFKTRVHATPSYEFIFTPAAPNASWRAIRPRLSRAARFFRSAVQDVSFVQAHSFVIVQHCIHLHTLIAVVDTGNSSMYGGIKDLTLHEPPSDLANAAEPELHDYSALTHLTLLGPCYPLRRAVPERAPNITHLCIRRDTCVVTRDTLVHLQHLTHLWFTPCKIGEHLTSYWPQTPLPEFLQHLHENCAALARVRIDAGRDEDVADIDHGLFPFVHVHRYTHVDSSWSSDTMWQRAPDVLDLTGNSDNAEESTLHIDTHLDVEMDSETGSSSDSSSSSSYDIHLEKTHEKLLNVYTARLTEYWMHRRYGGGWDD